MEDWLASEQSIDTLSITPVISSQDLLLGASSLSAECGMEVALWRILSLRLRVLPEHGNSLERRRQTKAESDCDRLCLQINQQYGQNNLRSVKP